MFSQLFIFVLMIQSGEFRVFPRLEGHQVSIIEQEENEIVTSRILDARKSFFHY